MSDSFVSVMVNVFGILGIITTVMVFQQKDNQKLLWWKLSTDSLWIVHYAFLGATSVVAVSLVAVFRSIILLNSKHAWARSKLWIAAFLISSLGFSIVAWQNWTSLLPTVGSLVCIIAYWIGIPRITRIVSVPASIMFLVKAVLDGSFWGTAADIFIFLSSVVGLVRLDMPNLFKKKTPVKEKD